MFDKLHFFFKKYFSESGSIYFSYTPLKSKIYEQVYSNDKDVVLFWKTNMLYYVKSDKIWNNLEIDFEKEGVKYGIKFDVSSLKHKKANEKKQIIYELKEVKGKDVIFSVSYSEKGRKTKIPEILKKLKDKKIFLEEDSLDKIFRTFEKQNEVDYFINKSAEKFLKEQFDMYLKNYLFDDESDFKESRLRELKALKDIVYKTIDFVSQFEDELVKVWNKPKFVLNSNYVITLDRITSYKEGLKVIEKILKDSGFKEQEKEWRELGILEKFDKNKLYDRDLNGKKISKEYGKLPIDTKYFSDNIKYEILSLFDNLDEQLDGWLIHSENYQALNTIKDKFMEKIQTIYIDPPFNLGTNADFLYNVNYKDSSWITLLENRIQLAKDLINKKGSMFVRCDYNGNMYVRLLMNDIFGEENFRNEIILSKSAKLTEQINHYHSGHDSLYFYTKSPDFYFKTATKKREEPKWREMHLPGIGWSPITEEQAKLFSKENIKRKNGKFVTRARIILGKELLPPEGRHWALSQDSIFQLEKEGKIKINEKGKPITQESDEQKLTDNWTDWVGYSSRWGFSTENHEQILKRCIQTSSANKNQIILDFFLGSGTTTAVAHKLGRRWIGVEMGEHFNFVVLPRMKKVLAGDKSGISKEKDVNWKGGGFFKYYDLEQYEQTLKRAVYKDSHPFENLDDNSIFKQYVFFKDLKLLDAIELNHKKNKVDIDFSKLYDNVDIAETLSCVTGESIKKIGKDFVVLSETGKIEFDNIPFKMIKRLVWW